MIGDGGGGLPGGKAAPVFNGPGIQDKHQSSSSYAHALLCHSRPSSSLQNLPPPPPPRFGAAPSLPRFPDSTCYDNFAGPITQQVF